MKNKKHLGVAFLLGIQALLFFIYFLNPNNTTLQDWSLGINISVIASFIFFLYTDYFFKEENANSELEKINYELQKRNQELEKNLNSVRKICTLQQEVTKIGMDGIKMIDPSDDTDTLWFDILNNSKENLCIIAHTLSPWFSNKYKTKFTNTIINLANAKYDIKILILSPNGTNLQLIACGNIEKYSQKIRNSLENLNEIYNKIDPQNRHHLQVKLNANYVIPYSYIQNDHNTYISPYLCDSEHRSSFITSYINEKRIAESFTDDFNSIFNNPNMLEYFPSQDLFEKIKIKETHSTLKNSYESINWWFEGKRSIKECL